MISTGVKFKDLTGSPSTLALLCALIHLALLRKIRTDISGVKQKVMLAVAVLRVLVATQLVEQFSDNRVLLTLA